jgi:hypothetical protein
MFKTEFERNVYMGLTFNSYNLRIKLAFHLYYFNKTPEFHMGIQNLMRSTEKWCHPFVQAPQYLSFQVSHQNLYYSPLKMTTFYSNK